PTVLAAAAAGPAAGAAAELSPHPREHLTALVPHRVVEFLQGGLLLVGELQLVLEDAGVEQEGVDAAQATAAGPARAAEGEAARAAATAPVVVRAHHGAEGPELPGVVLRLLLGRELGLLLLGLGRGRCLRLALGLGGLGLGGVRL